jgi:hypothetical protein
MAQTKARGMQPRPSSRGPPPRLSRPGSRPTSRDPVKASAKTASNVPAQLSAPVAKVPTAVPAQRPQVESARAPPQQTVPQPSPESILRKECGKKILEHAKEIMVTGMKLGTPAGM